MQPVLRHVFHLYGIYIGYRRVLPLSGQVIEKQRWKFRLDLEPGPRSGTPENTHREIENLATVVWPTDYGESKVER